MSHAPRLHYRKKFRSAHLHRLGYDARDTRQNETSPLSQVMTCAGLQCPRDVRQTRPTVLIGDAPGEKMRPHVDDLEALHVVPADLATRPMAEAETGSVKNQFARPEHSPEPLQRYKCEKGDKPPKKHLRESIDVRGVRGKPDAPSQKDDQAEQIQDQLPSRLSDRQGFAGHEKANSESANNPGFRRGERSGGFYTLSGISTYWTPGSPGSSTRVGLAGSANMKVAFSPVIWPATSSR